MIFRTVIETSRLSLRYVSLQDFDRFYGMCADPAVMKYIGDGNVFYWTKEVALKRYKDDISKQDNHEFGNMAVYRKDRDLYIGWCGVDYSKFLDHMELGYRYCRDAWGKGYGTEAASAILTEIYQLTGLDEILACVHPDNTASIRVLEKLRFSYTFSKFSKPIDRDIPIYMIDRKTFSISAQ